MQLFRELDVTGVRVLFADADGNLFPSEEPAFEASVVVMNEFLGQMGVDRRFTAEELRLATTGKNFRTTALDLCHTYGITCDDRALEEWVEREKRDVTRHLGAVLQPDDEVFAPLWGLQHLMTLAAVSSSATSRLDVCFAATRLHWLFPASRRFSAENSLPVPTSKPDPAIYTFAGRCLSVRCAEALAVEDSVVGARSAIAAGFPTVGNVMFVAAGERPERIARLRDAGVHGIVESWRELAAHLTQPQEGLQGVRP